MNKHVKQRTHGQGHVKTGRGEADRADTERPEDTADGRFEVAVSEDRMRAFISLFPSLGGGGHIGVDKVKKSLAEQKVVFGVNEELLKRLIENVEKTKDEKKGVIIAQGLLPEEGKEGLVRYHFQGREKVRGNAADRARTPVMTAKAKKGELLASIVKSIPGKEGKDVLGNPVPAPRVKDAKLLAGPNVRIDKGSMYYMEVDGIVEVFEGEGGVFKISGRPHSDGEFSIRIPDGEMEVLIDVRPSQGGGKPVDPAVVLGECGARGVAVVVDENAVRDAVFKAETEHVPVEGVRIARGDPAVHGSDGTVKMPVRCATGSRLSRLSDGSVDYKEQDLFTPVEKGTVLAEIWPPGRAVRSGLTVMGKVVEARNGREAALDAGDNTIVEKKEGYSRIIAAIDGRLFFDGKSASVEPVMLIEGDVGPKTGNVRFSGVVDVAGDVLDGYRVYGKKGLIVRGNVGNAEAKSEQNVTILNGVVGKGCGVVSAGGDVAVKFAENANIEAGGDILVQRAAMNCSMLSGGKIVAVQDKGQIVGGELRARFGVLAKVLGNDSEHRMEIFAGSDFFVERTLQETRRRLERCASEMKALELDTEKTARGVRKSDRKPDRTCEPESLEPDRGGSTKSGESLLEEVEELSRIENDCLLKLDELFDAQVTAQETLFRGVRVHFGKSVYEPEAAKTKVKISYDRDQRLINVCRT